MASLTSSNGCSWEVVPTVFDGPGTFGYRLHGITVLSREDIWVVGDLLDDREAGIQEAIAMRWNGSEWGLTQIPDLGLTSSLRDVAAITEDDIWAVGSTDNAQGTGPKSLIVHWDGTQWSRTTVPDPGTRFHHLNAIAALAPEDVWVVGGAATGNAGETFALHWDGDDWAIIPTPSPPPNPLVGAPYASLESISALSSGSIWAVGESINVSPGGPSNTLIEQWDGDLWRVIRSPDVESEKGRPFNHLFGVAAAAPDYAWAVGISGSSPGFYGGGDDALVQRWNGDDWVVSELPPLPADSRLFDVEIGPEAAWAAGSTGFSGSFRPLALRWDGQQWATVKLGEIVNGWLTKLTMDSSGSVWAVGAIEEAESTRPLVLRCV